MKKYALLLCLLIPMGCATATSPTPPLAPGYVDTNDQSLGAPLAAANGFYNKLQSDQVAGTFKPTSSEVTALNALQSALKVANPIYLAYHNGKATYAEAQAAIAKVSTAKTNAETLITGGK